MKLSRREFVTGSAVSLTALPFLQPAQSYAAPAEKGVHKGPRKFIDVDGVRTSYFEGGSGDHMVLVHGGHFGSPGSSAIVWTVIFPMLAAHFHVYALDKLGMGLTDNPLRDDDYTMRATVDHLYRFIQKKGIRKIHLMGQSRGGLPVTRIAIDHPELVETLTIVDSNTTAPGDPPPVSGNLPAVFMAGGPAITKDSVRKNLLSTLYSKENIDEKILEEMVEQHLEVALSPKTRQAAERLELLRSRFVESNRDKVTARPALGLNSGTGWWMYQVKDETLAAIAEGRLTVPTLILWGFNDPGASYTLGIDLFKLVSKSTSRAQFHLFNHCSHWPFVEYPQDTTDYLVDFIKNS